MQSKFVAFLSVVILAGCMQPSPNGDGEEVPHVRPLLPDCTSHEFNDESCIRTISRVSESLQEPDLAIDPSDPSRWAIGVNAGQTLNSTSASPLVAEYVRLGIILSEDAGKTWRDLAPPAIPAFSTLPVALGRQADPSLVFDAQGALHVSGIVSHESGRGFDVFYYSTPDRGETWSTPILLTQTGNADRQWLSIVNGRLHAVWQERQPGQSVVRSSDDGGKTWGEALRAERCIMPSPVVEVGDASRFVCASGTGVRIIDVSPELGTETDLRADQITRWPRILARGTTAAVLYEEGGGSSYASVSLDSGLTWSEFQRLPINAKSDELDRHLTAAVLTERDIRVLAADTRSAAERGSLVRLTLLQVSTPGIGLISSSNLSTVPPSSTIPPAAPTFADDFHSLEQLDGRTVVVWSRQGTLAILVARDELDVDGGNTAGFQDHWEAIPVVTPTERPTILTTPLGRHP